MFANVGLYTPRKKDYRLQLLIGSNCKISVGLNIISGRKLILKQAVFQLKNN
jgi:hypothetical protein